MMKTNYRFKSTAKACFSLFKIKTAASLQYRIAGLAGASTSIFWVLIEITVYTIFYTYGNNKESVITTMLTLKQVVTYAWLTQIFFLMQPMSIDSEILNKITNGDIGIELCRPLDLYFHWFSKTAASRLTPLFWRGSIVLIFGMIMPKSYRLSPPASLLGFVCMLLSILIALLLCTSYAMLTCAVRLNISWGDGPTYIMMLIGGVLSGCYLPLQLWPKFMQSFLLIQPFAGYLDIPLRFYIGTISPKNAVWAIGIQLVWIITFIIAGRMLMTKRLKTIIVQGG
ncbi:MAG: putative rane protein [Clostridiales bacterium]|nr:putative rane protein [Clostridiales bacterium]